MGTQQNYIIFKYIKLNAVHSVLLKAIAYVYNFNSPTALPNI